MASLDVSPSKRCSTPATLVDVDSTIVASMCGQLDANENGLPGSNLIDIARDRPDGRVAFSELQNDGPMTGELMLRASNWKLIHYVGHPPQLFDLTTNPFEKENLADKPETSAKQEVLYAEPLKVGIPD